MSTFASTTAAINFAAIAGWTISQKDIAGSDLQQVNFVKGDVTLKALAYRHSVEVLDVAREQGESFTVLGEGNADRLFRWLEEA